MKIQTLISLLFVAAASLLVEVNGDQGVCPHEFYKSHPEFHEKKMEIMKKYGLPDFSRLPSCSENAECADNRLCCKTPCGKKCMRPINENNAEQSLELLKTELYSEDAAKPYVETEEDRRLGMCPDNYLKTHPELQEKVSNFWKNKKDHKCNKDCKDGEQCTQKKKDKGHKHFQHLASLPACTADSDCQNEMRCCQTMCGKKCRKPVKTDEEYFKSIFGDRKKNKEKRDLRSQEKKQEGEDDGAEHGRGHGKGLENGKGAKNGKGHGKGLEHGKGAKNGKGHGKGLEHGKGAKNGKGHGKGLEHGKGAENGKGHGKGLEHSKGAQNDESPKN